MDTALQTVQTYILNPLHPYLSPLTSNLPKPIQETLTSLLGAPCYSALLLDLNIASHPECTTLALSKLVGTVIISASAVVKIPQLLKLLSSQSSAGLSLPSLALETAAFAITLAYNVRREFPFSTYGETALIFLQNLAIGYFTLLFDGKHYNFASVFPVTALSFVIALFSADIVPDSLLTTFQAFAGVLGTASKLPQILANYNEGGTGQLSAFAVFNYLIGSLMRILTSLREVDDKLILAGFVAGFALNAVLAGQMAYYWNAGATAKHGEEARVAADKAAERAEAVASGAAQRIGATRRKA
ncbi:MAG: hypothetical protein Q9227_000698 [Pyrenula ochraceoflavens]